MSALFKKLIKKLKAVVTYPYYRRLYLKSTVNTFKKNNVKYAIVNLDYQLRFDDYSRYFYTICIYLKKAGFEVVVKTTMRDFKAFLRPGGGILNLFGKKTTFSLENVLLH